MSLRVTLVLLYGVLLTVLMVALGVFYWAVERSLTDQHLLAAAGRQLEYMDSFSNAMYRQVAATKGLLLGNDDKEAVSRHRTEAEAKLERLSQTILAELQLLKQFSHDSRRSTKWIKEMEEFDTLLQIQKLYIELCAAGDRAMTQHADMGRNELLSTFRDIDKTVDKRLAPLLDNLKNSERAELQSRVESMYNSSRLFEKIVIGTFLATLIVVSVGIVLLRRVLDDLARKEGEMAANRAKAEFLANMSHEIRTPMTGILGFADILAQGLTDPEKIEAAAIIKRNSEHLLEILNDILDLSKIDAGQLDVECERCSPRQIAGDVIAMMRGRATAKALLLSLEFDGPIPETVLSSPLRLRQILLNLVGNAIKFTEVGGIRLMVRLARDKAGKSLMQFDVSDTGIGIAKENMGRLFKPFTQVDSSSIRAAEGTGLGLAISQRLAKQLGGGISVASDLGKGSVFSLTVRTGPLDDVKMADAPTGLSPSPEPLPPAMPQERPKLAGHVLIVEDGPDNLRLLSFLLKRAGAKVTTAEDGVAALRIIERAICDDAVTSGEYASRPPFDVILMDMQMPRMDGYELTRRLREMGYCYPIIALTAHATSTDRQKCVEAGCDDYATKPIMEADLLETLAMHMRADVGDATLTQ